MTPFARHAAPAMLALVIAAPIAWEVSDSTLPHVRLSGRIAETRAGESFEPEWATTRHVRDCPGLVQIEIIDAEDEIHIKPRREAFQPPVGSTSFTPDSWILPVDAIPGPAIYRVTTFWYCTAYELYFNRPLVQVGPDIHFTILPKLGATP
jgi:hypothetical protein